MIEVKFFARLREQLNQDSMSVAYREGMSVSELIQELRKAVPEFEKYLAQGFDLLCAVNQTMVDKSQLLNDGDEVALFPPVTGG